VYLYRRLSPERLVAIKALRTTDMSDNLVKRFTAEANAMAALSHPHIAQVYANGITADGRPYIEMAYYPNGSLEDRVRQAPLSVPDVLRIGVQLCSAVETAHRLDPPLLHRDIKPANVLIDEYNDPVLTDFGIASRITDQNDEVSLSVYWAAPEVMFSTSPVDKRSDVYSLGALLWHLLVGRAPYVIPGGDNRPSPTMIRARDLPVPGTGRTDVPPTLERLLASTMNKDPRLRPATAADLARSLNAIEQNQYGFARVTPFKVRASEALQPVVTFEVIGDDHTRARSNLQTPKLLVPQPVMVPPPTYTALPASGEPPQSYPGSPAWNIPDDPATILRRSPQIIDDRTVLNRPPNVDAARPVDTQPEATPPHKVGLIIAIVVVVVIAAGGSWWLMHTSHSGSAPPPSTTPTGDSNIGLNLPPGPVTINCSRPGNGTEVSCTWDYVNNLTTDSYKVLLPDGSQTTTTQPSFSTQDASSQQYCIEIKVVRADGRFPATNWSQAGCA